MKTFLSIRIIVIIAATAICTLLNEYSIETIAAFFGKEIDFPKWGAFLLALVPGLGQLCIPIAAIVFALAFFL